MCIGQEPEDISKKLERNQDGETAGTKKKLEIFSPLTCMKLK
jgi:hypothetical protein